MPGLPEADVIQITCPWCYGSKGYVVRGLECCGRFITNRHGEVIDCCNCPLVREDGTVDPRTM